MVYLHCTKCGKAYRPSGAQNGTRKVRGMFNRIKIKNIKICCGRELRVIPKSAYMELTK